MKKAKNAENAIKAVKGKILRCPTDGGRPTIGKMYRVSRQFRRSDDTFVGVLRAQSETHELYSVVDDLLIWNGFRLVRKKDVVKHESEAHQEFYLRVLRKKKLSIPSLAKGLTQIDVPTVLRLLMNAKLCGSFFFEEFQGGGEFHMGMVQAVGVSSFEIVAVDTFAEKYNEMSQLNFASLTRVDFLGEYERSFDLVLKL